MDRVLEQERLDRLDVVETEVVEVRRSEQLRRQLGVEAGVVDVDARVDVLRLPLFLARPQTRDETARLLERDVRARQAQRLLVPEARAGRDGRVDERAIRLGEGRVDDE